MVRGVDSFPGPAGAEAEALRLCDEAAALRLCEEAAALRLCDAFHCFALF